MRFLAPLILVACKAQVPDDTDPDTDPSSDTDTDTDVGGEALTGDPWSGTVDMSLYVTAPGGGTTVGSFAYCSGPATLGVDGDLVGADLVCAGDFACTGHFRGQPVSGPWSMEWSCDEGAGEVELAPTTTPPDPIDLTASWEWTRADGAVFAYGLTLAASPGRVP
ncbi:MAG: hypothetical protein R3F61_32820 [Myxococcota bacterium]